MTDSSAPRAIAFSLVPVAARHDGWTPARQTGFIAQLARIGLVGPAARAVGMSPKSAYALRKRPGAESFADAWDTALMIGEVTAAATAIDRAINGELHPVFWRGRKVGEVRRFNDRLLAVALSRYWAAERKR